MLLCFVLLFFTRSFETLKFFRVCTWENQVAREFDSRVRSTWLSPLLNLSYARMIHAINMGNSSSLKKSSILISDFVMWPIQNRF